MAEFDVVIPFGPKDEDMIDRCVSSIYMNVVGFRYIYVIAKSSRDISGALVLDERDFPFNYEAVLEKTSEVKAGWYLQQLIKLYSPLLISDILDNVLIVDADTVFYKRTKFIENGKYLYDKVVEPTHQPYFDHMARLHPSFVPWKRNTSGITNLMLFNKKILIEIMEKVETKHKKNFWEAFLDCVTEKTTAGASEYELYFNYMMNTKQELVRVRPLQWSNHGQRLDKKSPGAWHYVNYHHQHQKKPRTFA
jgi:hypothetical protein